ncbi:MAG: 23S rRNA (pseudouridine(1915)-N(3))-methyltransferase RlmH [Nitrosomonas sp.]
MKVFIIAVGNKMPNWIQQGFNEYIKRLPHEISLQLIEIKPEKRSSGKTVEQLLYSESERILAALPSACRMIVLDEHGHQWTTLEFSQVIKQWLLDSNAIAFVIGGADGLHPNLKRIAHKTFALSHLTLPHAMVRVVLAEQLYRAVSVLQGHPYHRN